MLNCVLHVEQLFSSTCFDGLVDNISDVTSGPDGSVWGFVKNVVGRLQFVKNPFCKQLEAQLLVVSIPSSGLIMPPGCHNQRELEAWFWRHFRKDG